MADPEITILAETESFSVWQSDEPDGEVTYHLELGGITVHLFREELQEVVDLVRQIGDHAGER
jgi:hypothetical protein